MRRAKKHKMDATAFGGQLFYTRLGSWRLCPPGSATKLVVYLFKSLYGWLCTAMFGSACTLAGDNGFNPFHDHLIIQRKFYLKTDPQPSCNKRNSQLCVYLKARHKNQHLVSFLKMNCHKRNKSDLGQKFGCNLRRFCVITGNLIQRANTQCFLPKWTF